MTQDASLQQNMQPLAGMPGLNPSVANPAQGKAAYGQDPRLMAMVQQALQNPHAGDGFNAAQTTQSAPVNWQVPSAAQLPEASADGQPPVNPLGDLIPMHPMDIAGGVAAGLGAGLGMEALQKRNVFLKIAEGLDTIPVLSQISGFVEKTITPRLRNRAWFAEISPHFTVGGNKAEAVQAAVTKMQARHIESSLKKIAANAGKHGGDWARLHSLLNGAESRTNFEKFVQTADKLQGETFARPVAKALRRARNEIYSHKQQYLPYYTEHANMLYELGARKVGPLGRAFASGMNVISRVFGGETMMSGMGLGKKATQGVGGKLFGSAVSGWFIFGQAFNQARKAKEGEKKQAFFHNLFGLGIANFIGWELGKRWLRSMDFGNVVKFLGLSPGASPFFFLRGIKGVRILAGLTFGGIATEVMAMFVIGALFQKMGEKVAHKIFGKPSEESLNGKKPGAGSVPAQAQPVRAGGSSPGSPTGGQALRHGFNQFQSQQASTSPMPQAPLNQGVPAPSGQGVQAPGAGLGGLANPELSNMPRRQPQTQSQAGGASFELTPEQIATNPNAAPPENNTSDTEAVAKAISGAGIGGSPYINSLLGMGGTPDSKGGGHEPKFDSTNLLDPFGH